MHMIDSEIISNFKNGSNKPKEQVKVLADLIAVPVQDMAKKCKELGLPVDVRWFTSAENGGKKTVKKAETPETILDPALIVKGFEPKSDKMRRINALLLDALRIMMED